MHIVMLHYAAPPVIGGVERVIFYHAKYLAAIGHDVHVVAGRGDIFDSSVAFHSVDLIDSRHPLILEIKQALDTGRVPETFEAMVTTIESMLRPLLADAKGVIAHNVLSLHKNLPLTAALYRIAADDDGPPLIAWHHDLAGKAVRYQPEMHTGYPWSLLHQAWPRTIHVAVSEARRLDVASTFQIPMDLVRVIPGGVDPAWLFGLDADTESLLAQAGLLEDGPCLLLPARITRRKNIELAIRTVGALRPTHPDVRLLVTGPPGPHNPENASYFAELQRLRHELGLEQHVLFLTEALGHSPDDDLMKALYLVCDALLLPSYEEGFGLPILEAGLARLPIFCSDIPALRELVGAQAHIFSPDSDPASVAALIEHVLGSNSAAILRQRVLDRYSWSHIVRRHIEPLLQEDR